MKYELARERRISSGARTDSACVLPAGTVVYPYKGVDYGCADDDTRITGATHVAVTLDAGGGLPFFTVPEADLVPAREGCCPSGGCGCR